MTDRTVTLEIEINMDSGEYDICVRNTSNPGGSMDYGEILATMGLIFKDQIAKAGTVGEA